jgi:hypothetical protein
LSLKKEENMSEEKDIKKVNEGDKEFDDFLKTVGTVALVGAAAAAVILAVSPKARSFIWGGLIGMGAKGMRDEWNQGVPRYINPYKK